MAFKILKNIEELKMDAIITKYVKAIQMVHQSGEETIWAICMEIYMEPTG